MVVQVAAVKKTKHGGYGRRLAIVEISISERNESDIHATALVELQKLLPGLKITTEIVSWEN